MSSSDDPEQWVFPQQGAASPPSSQSSVFGPINLNDVMKLEWTPASQTPEVTLYCTPIAPDGSMGLQTATLVSTGDHTSPLLYSFDVTQDDDGGGQIFCQ
jgi:hypothetical protein